MKSIGLNLELRKCGEDTVFNPGDNVYLIREDGSVICRSVKAAEPYPDIFGNGIITDKHVYYSANILYKMYTVETVEGFE